MSCLLIKLKTMSFFDQLKRILSNNPLRENVQEVIVQ